MSAALYWLVAGLALFLAELLVGSFFLMWIGAGALLTALLALFVKIAWIQWLFFAIAAIVLLALTRPLAHRLHAAAPIVSNVDALQGLEGVVLETIDPEANTGRIRVRSEEWRARSTERIPAGARVIIEGVEGTTLRVRRAVENQPS